MRESYRTFHGPRFDFIVLSRSRIRTAVIEQPHIVISIGDPGDSDAEIAPSPLSRAILRLQFDDIDPARPSLRRGLAMAAEDARAVVDFVRLHTGDDGVSTIVCQCGLGISRSAGVAAALSRALQGEDAFFFAEYSPNGHVYRAILAASGEQKAP